MAKRLVNVRSKKQPFPFYLHAKTCNCCFLILIGRKNLSLLFHSYFIRVLTVIGNCLEIVSFSRQGQIIANYRNVRCIAGIDNDMSKVNTIKSFVILAAFRRSSNEFG